MTKKILALLLICVLSFGLLAGCGAKEETASNEETQVATEPIKIGIPDDATNGGRGIKLLEKAGLIEVDPAAGWTPEIKDVTKYLYNIEIVPTTANTLPATLDDFGGATINGTYAVPAGLIPSKDGLIVETQEGAGSADNPYRNIVAARTSDKDNEVYKTVVAAVQQELVAQYINAKYNETYIPVFTYETTNTYGTDAEVLELIDNYESDSAGKTIVKLGVCGSSNQYWNAAQYILDEQGANIYLELVEFDAYTLPNEALNSGEIDLNSFQHVAFMNSEIEKCQYDITNIGDTIMAPLTLYSKAYADVDALKAAAGALE